MRLIVFSLARLGGKRGPLPSHESHRDWGQTPEANNTYTPNLPTLLLPSVAVTEANNGVCISYAAVVQTHTESERKNPREWKG